MLVCAASVRGRTLTVGCAAQRECLLQTLESVAVDDADGGAHAGGLQPGFT